MVGVDAARDGSLDGRRVVGERDVDHAPVAPLEPEPAVIQMPAGLDVADVGPGGRVARDRLQAEAVEPDRRAGRAVVVGLRPEGAETVAGEGGRAARGPDRHPLVEVVLGVVLGPEAAADLPGVADPLGDAGPAARLAEQVVQGARVVVVLVPVGAGHPAGRVPLHQGCHFLGSWSAQTATPSI